MNQLRTEWDAVADHKARGPQTWAFIGLCVAASLACFALAMVL